jgi:ABC-2 type transport system permease protein
MTKTLALVRREFVTYFRSPIPYLLLALYLVLAGTFFYLGLATGGEASLRALVPALSVILMILTPAITMRLLSEETKSGTLEVLLTDPVTEWQLVLGKFLGSLAFFALLVSVCLVYGLLLEIYGTPDWIPLLWACLGLLLYGGSMIAIGLFFSSLTRNQVVAYVTALVALLALFLIDDVSALAGGTVAVIGRQIGLQEHYDSFQKGLLDTRVLIYFASTMALFLFLTVRSVESRRWR